MGSVDSWIFPPLKIQTGPDETKAECSARSTAAEAGREEWAPMLTGKDVSTDLTLQTSRPKRGARAYLRCSKRGKTTEVSPRRRVVRISENQSSVTKIHVFRTLAKPMNMKRIASPLF